MFRFDVFSKHRLKFLFRNLLKFLTLSLYNTSTQIRNKGCEEMVSKSSRINSRAQVSMEYLIIFGIAFAMTIPLIIIYARQTGNMQADVTQMQIYKAASKISDYAEQVYYMGEPSQRTLYINFPAGINEVRLNGTMIIFNVTTTDLSYQVVKETAANVTGNIKSFEGQHILTFIAQTNVVSITDK